VDSFLDRHYPGTLSGLAKSMGDMKQHFMWRVFELCRDDDTTFRRRCIRRNARIDLDDLLTDCHYVEKHKSEIIRYTLQIKAKFFSDVSWKRDPGAAIDGYLIFTDKRLTLIRADLAAKSGPNDNNLKDYMVSAMIFYCMQRAQDIYWGKIVNNPQYMKYAEENLGMLREETDKTIKMMYELFEIDQPLMVSPDAITLEGISQARSYPTAGQIKE
jgi:hypothetical protein